MQQAKGAKGAPWYILEKMGLAICSSSFCLSSYSSFSASWLASSQAMVSSTAFSTLSLSSGLSLLATWHHHRRGADFEIPNTTLKKGRL